MLRDRDVSYDADLLSYALTPFSCDAQPAFDDAQPVCDDDQLFHYDAQPFHDVSQIEVFFQRLQLTQ